MANMVNDRSDKEFIEYAFRGLDRWVACFLGGLNHNVARVAARAMPVAPHADPGRGCNIPRPCCWGVVVCCSATAAILFYLVRQAVCDGCS